MNPTFEMVAKTFQGLEGVLADELRALGATDVTPGIRMVSFTGDKAMLYKANMCCRTALRILKPFYSFKADNADQLYDKVKEFDWSTLLTPDKTFSIDNTVYSDEFKNSQFVTYRVKDAIVDWFRDRDDEGRRPSVRLDGADVEINVHVSGKRVSLSLDSSGESLHRRGWRRAQTEAPISEVLAAGIILLSGWRGDTPFVDPMCGSGTFLIEAAMIAANIYPGVYRSHFAFETWPDFDRELFEEIYNDDSAEREVTVPIVGADIHPKAIEIARENAKGAGVERYITFATRPIADWTPAEVPTPAGVLVTNPPYGKRIGADDMNALYRSIGTTFKHAFRGYHCWVIGYEDEYFHEIGLAPSQKIAVNNGGLDCELREYVIFEGTKRDFRAGGGRIKEERPAARPDRKGGFRDRKDERPERKGGFRDRKDERPERKGGFRDRNDERPERKGGFRDRKDERPERKGGFRDRKDEGGVREHRPLNLKRLGSMPSIPADKEIVINRPMWRTRKRKAGEGTDGTEK